MRLAAKTASWSIVHMIVAIGVAYALTQNWRAALAVGLIEPIFQTIAFALHERAWARRSPARAVARPRITHTSQV